MTPADETPTRINFNSWVWPLLIGQLIAAFAWGVQTHVRLAQIELTLNRQGKALDALNDVSERIVRIEERTDAIYRILDERSKK